MLITQAELLRRRRHKNPSDRNIMTVAKKKRRRLLLLLRPIHHNIFESFVISCQPSVACGSLRRTEMNEGGETRGKKVTTDDDSSFRTNVTTKTWGL